MSSVCHYRKFVFATAMVVLLNVAAHARATMTPIYDPYSNSDLYVVGSNSSTWSQAEVQAQLLGGNLVTIHSAVENQYIVNSIFKDLAAIGGPALSNASQLYIGLTDPKGLVSDDGAGATHAANFTWVNGEGSTYRNWYMNEPNDGNGGPHEYYSAMWGPDGIAVSGGLATITGQWNDVAELYIGPTFSTGFYGLAEVSVPEPVSIGLISVVALMAMRLRKRIKRPASS